MTMFDTRLPLTALLLALAVPAAAQMAPPPPAGPGMEAGHGHGGEHRGMMMRGGQGGGMGMHGMAGMFDALSPEGRKTMHEAMMTAGTERKGVHEQVKAARDRMLTILDADRLDTGALKRAMDDEQAASNAARDRMQAAMLSGFSRLTVADRKAFVAYSHAMRNRMDARMAKWRGRGGKDGSDMPMPPPM